MAIYLANPVVKKTGCERILSPSSSRLVVKTGLNVALATPLPF
jgi:hypothetical protein